MKNIFKNLMKYGIFGIGVSILCIAFSASASTTTSFWTQTAPNVLMTNASGGLATAAIHVSQCYIGTSTSTPCGGSGSGIAIGENIAGGTPKQVLYTDNSGNLFSDADFMRDSSTQETIIKQDDGSNFDTYFGLNKNIDGFGIPGGILEQDDNTNNLQAIVTTTPAFGAEPSVLIAAEPISTGNVDESEIGVSDLGNDIYSGQWNVLNDNQQTQTVLQLNKTDAALNYSADGGNTSSGFSAFSGISEVNASDVGTGNSMLFGEDAANEQYIFDQPNFQIDSVPYIFPSSQGTVGTTLTNDGTGALSWSATAPQPPISGVTIDVRLAIAAILSHSPTYNNGSSGVGATLTASSNGALSVNGIAVALNDLILVDNQASALQNGVYDVTTLGTPSVPYILTRDTQADMSAQFDDMVVTATQGSNRAINYAQQTQSVVIGTSNIVFSVQASPYVREQTSGTQAAGQIPVYTGTANTITKGSGNFAYYPATGQFAVTDPSNDYSIFGSSGGGVQLASDNVYITSASGATNPIIHAAQFGGGNFVALGDVNDNLNGTKIKLTDATQQISFCHVSNCYIFPVGHGTVGQTFVDDGSGNLSWGTPTISSLAWSSITGTPTTLSGYGITNAYPLMGNPSGFLTSSSTLPWSQITSTPTTLAGYGITNAPTIVGTGDVTAQTTANASIVAFTTGGATSTYRIGGYLNITALSLDVIQLQCTYTDENSNVQTVILATGSTVVDVNVQDQQIRAKNGTAITIKTVLTTGTGSITYDAGGTIEKVR